MWSLMRCPKQVKARAAAASWSYALEENQNRPVAAGSRKAKVKQFV